MNIKQRNPIAVVIFSIITFGIYGLYWIVKTKGEINGMGGKIPTAWLIIIPFVNLYFAYRYSEAFSLYVKKDDNPILWFLLWLVLFPAAMIFVQIELNKHAVGGASGTPPTTASV